MRVKIFTLILTFGITTSLFSQSTDLKLANDGGDDYGNKMVLSGNGIVVCGSTSNGTPGGNYDVILQGFDTSGNSLWVNQYGGSGTEYGTGLCSNGNGYAITGRTNTFSSNGSMDISLMLTDPSGTLLKGRAYHTDNDEYGEYIINTADGGYLISGTTGYDTSAGGNVMALIKTDANGDLQWGRGYGGSGQSDGSFIQAIPGNEYVIIGTSNSPGGAGGNDLMLTLVDSIGDVILQGLLGGSGDEEGVAILPVSQNNVLLAGTSGSLGQDHLFLASLNTSNFTLNWAKVYAGSVQEQMSRATLTYDGNVLLSGFTASFGNSNGQNGLIMETDTNGNVLWTTVLGDTGFTQLQDQIPLSDGSVIFTGYTDSFNLAVSGNNDIIGARTTPAGALCNMGRAVTLNTVSWTPTLNIAIGGLAGFTSDTVPFVNDTVAYVVNSNPSNVANLCTAAALVANAGSNKTVCRGSNKQLGGSPTGSGGTAPLSYLWSPSNGLSSDTAANPTANVLSTTTYTVTVTDHVGLTATAAVTLTVDSPAAVNFTVSPDTLCTNGGSVTLSATPSGGVFSGNGVSGTSFSPATAGAGTDTLVYTYTDTIGCQSFGGAIVTVEVCGAINNITSPSFYIAPNPSNGYFELSLTNPGLPGKLKVYDLTGRIVYNSELDASSVIKLSLNNLSAGTYLVQLTQENQTYCRKIVIE